MAPTNACIIIVVVVIIDRVAVKLNIHVSWLEIGIRQNYIE